MAMSLLSFATVSTANALALISLGGALYGFLVVDPAWPRRPDIIQPARGGISQKRFWIPAHTAFELALIASLVLTWTQPTVRPWLWVGFSSHVAMRLWSAFDFIPKALAFERAEPGSITEAIARRWTRRSRLRLPLDLITCWAMFHAFVSAVRLA
jgi:hypothetical protein